MKQLMIVVVVLAACLPASAQQAPRMGGPDLKLPAGRWWENPKVVAELTLSADQQTRIADLVYRHATRMIDLKAGVEKAELELGARVGRADFDPEQVRAAFAAFQRTRQELESERFEMLLEVRQQLSPSSGRSSRGCTGSGSSGGRGGRGSGRPAPPRRRAGRAEPSRRRKPPSTDGRADRARPSCWWSSIEIGGAATRPAGR